MYLDWLSQLSSWSSLPVDFIDNLIVSTLTVSFYFPIKMVICRFLYKNFSKEDDQGLVNETVPPLLKLILIGILINTWFLGKASLATLFAFDQEAVRKVVLSSFVYLFYKGMTLLSDGFIDIKYPLEPDRQFNIRRTNQIILGIICLLSIFKIWIASSSDLSTYLGLVSAGIAIALQDVIVSIVGWLYIMSVKPFQIGDRIQLGDHRGDVTDLRLFQFSILETGNWVDADQSTGRILHFPNSFVFKNPVANYHSGFDYIFTEIPVMVTFESDWKKASNLLETILLKDIGNENREASKQIRKASRSMKINFVHTEPKVITKVADSGIVMTLRFLCKIKERRFIEQKVWVSILNAFSKEDSIDFAYPTQRFYTNNMEGKSEAGGPPKISEKKPNPESLVRS